MVMDFQSCPLQLPQKSHQSHTFFANPHDLMKKNACKNVSVSVERRFPPTTILLSDFQQSCQQSAPSSNWHKQVVHSYCMFSPKITITQMIFILKNSFYILSNIHTCWIEFILLLSDRDFHSSNSILVFLFFPGTSRSGGERRRAPSSRTFGL